MFLFATLTYCSDASTGMDGLAEMKTVSDFPFLNVCRLHSTPEDEERIGFTVFRRRFLFFTMPGKISVYTVVLLLASYKLD
jgi:hypothetical protein